MLSREAQRVAAAVIAKFAPRFCARSEVIYRKRCTEKTLSAASDELATLGVC